MNDKSPFRPSPRSLDHKVQLGYARVDALIAAHKRFTPPEGSTLKKLSAEDLESVRRKWYGLIDAASQGDKALRAEIGRLIPPTDRQI